MTNKGKVDAFEPAEDNTGLCEMASTVRHPGVAGLGMLYIGTE